MVLGAGIEFNQVLLIYTCKEFCQIKIVTRVTKTKDSNLKSVTCSGTGTNVGQVFATSTPVTRLSKRVISTCVLGRSTAGTSEGKFFSQTVINLTGQNRIKFSPCHEEVVDIFVNRILVDLQGECPECSGNFE